MRCVARCTVREKLIEENKNEAGRGVCTLNQGDQGRFPSSSASLLYSEAPVWACLLPQPPPGTHSVSQPLNPDTQRSRETGLSPGCHSLTTGR